MHALVLTNTKPYDHHISKPRKFRPILVADAFGFVDVLISFCCEKVKLTAANDPKTGWIQYLRNHWS